MDNRNVRPEDMERITTPALAKAFIEDQIEYIKEQVGDKKVLLALSGGVDSSVCVRILQDQGFQVEGLVLEFSPAHKPAVEAATAAAKKLGIPLHVQKCYEEFEREVIEPFCSEYCAGITPSPCILCNPAVKFRLLAAAADEMGIEFISGKEHGAVDKIHILIAVFPGLNV